MRFRTLTALPLTMLGFSLFSVGSASAANLTAPVIHEPFVTPKCTAAQEKQSATSPTLACLEHQLVGLDKQIDQLNARIFNLFTTNIERQDLISAQATWFAFRQSDCVSQAAIWASGPGGKTITISCAVNDDQTRISDLYNFERSIESDA